MAVNYEDERFKNVESQEKQALQSANNTYNNMINQADKYYNDMTKAADDYGKQQAQIQQANTNFAIKQIEQQKDEAAKSYTKEQKGAYQDWQKQSNQYGVNAEQLASSGLSQTGYSESSQVSMYNTYQNRLGQARDTYNKAVLEYDNGIEQARLSNNAKLAEIAYQSLQTKLELGLNQFQYKNQLLGQQMEMQQSISNNYYNRYQDVLKQINNEKQMAEEQRQFNEQMAEKKREYDASLAEDKRQFNANLSLKGSGSSISLGGSGNGKNKKGNSITIDPKAKMSSKAENLYKKLKMAWDIANKSSIGGVNMPKDVAYSKIEQTLSNALKNNLIDDNELKIIAARLGV